jgi:hypothetical protein
VTKPDYVTHLRWYPVAWRQRYGEEFVSLLDETYAGQRVPLKASLSIVRAGALERVRDFGVIGDGTSDQRAITGSALTVLMAWVVFVVTGSVFAKYAEHWQWVTASNERTLPSAAYDAVAVGALLGVVITGAAALAVVPAFVRLVRSEGWQAVRAPLRRSLIAGMVALASSGGIVLWAHSLHGGGAVPFWPNRLVFLLWFALVAVAIFVVAASAGTVTRRIHLEARTTRTLGALALSMNVVLVVIFAGVLTWWGAIAANSPWFFSSEVLHSPTATPGSITIVGSTNHVAPVLLIVIGLAMLVSLLAALYNAARITTRLRRAG